MGIVIPIGAILAGETAATVTTLVVVGSVGLAVKSCQTPSHSGKGRQCKCGGDAGYGDVCLPCQWAEQEQYRNK